MTEAEILLASDQSHAADGTSSRIGLQKVLLEDESSRVLVN